MTAKILKIARVIISLLFFLVLTAALTAAPLAIPGVAAWMEYIQFFPAVISFSLVIFVSWLIITLVFGRIYCSGICPLGTFQDVVWKCSNSCNPRTLRYSRPIYRLRYLSLLIVILSMMCGYFVIPSLVDPYSAYARICNDLLNPTYNLIAGEHDKIVNDNQWNTIAIKALTGWASTSIAIISLGAITSLSASKARLFCNSICPVGTTLGLISRYAIFQIYIDTDKCTNCRNCEYACKANCINLNDHVVDSSRCVNCFNCLTACNDDAIHYTFRRKQLSIPMMQSIKPIQAAREPQLDSFSETTDSHSQKIDR